MKYTVGSVPYANAIPLVAWIEKHNAELEELGRPNFIEPVISVRYEVPSKLPDLLESQEAQAILVSSIDAIRSPGRRMAAGVCIGSDGPVKSVRLFSRVPFNEIRSLALDQSSMTSNRLAQILLAEQFGAEPHVETLPPSLDRMLATHDACVLIGDIGMLAPSEGLHVLDLGEAWREQTGLPFVWAAWIGTRDLTPELAYLLNVSADHYMAGRDLAIGGYEHKHLASDSSGIIGQSVALLKERHDELVKIGIERAGWEDSMLRDYFFQVMKYRMDDRALDGLREFQRLLLKHGFDDCHHFPVIVEPNTPTAL